MRLIRKSLLILSMLYISLSEANDDVSFEVSANHLIWEESKETLRLEGSVSIYSKGIGTLTNNDLVLMTYQEVNGRKQIYTVESRGVTTLKFVDEDLKIDHTLTCAGTVFVDNKEMQTVMRSPVDLKGNVAEENQIVFEDHMGKVLSDQLLLNYTIENSAIIPKEILLEGNIRVFTGNKSKNETYMQYAMADRVAYSPEAKEVYLTANPGKRVLYNDRLNNMQVSAKALKIRRDRVTNKEEIEGIGDVRFILLEQELEALKQAFGK